MVQAQDHLDHHQEVGLHLVGGQDLLVLGLLLGDRDLVAILILPHRANLSVPGLACHLDHLSDPALGDILCRDLWNLVTVSSPDKCLDLFQ